MCVAAEMIKYKSGCLMIIHVIIIIHMNSQARQNRRKIWARATKEQFKSEKLVTNSER